MTAPSTETMGIGERWEKGIPHDPRSVALYRAISDLDFTEGGDRFCFKSGGDGDNGEHLMYLLDIHFSKQPHEPGDDPAVLREYLRIYGGHIPPCAGRPCECGFAKAWDVAKLPKPKTLRQEIDALRKDFAVAFTLYEELRRVHTIPTIKFGRSGDRVAAAIKAAE